MADYFLDAPVYTEPKESVKLVLRNNIIMRRHRQELHAIDRVGTAVWEKLNSTERQLLTYMVNHGAASRAELSTYVGRSSVTILTRLNALIARGLVKGNGGKYAPNRTYEAVLPSNTKIER